MSADNNKKPFETASATTDPDNSNSGPFAYIITGIALAGLLIFGVACSSCASIALTAVASNGGPSGIDTPNSQVFPYGDEDFDFDDFDQWFNQYDFDGDDGNSGNNGNGSSTDNNDSASASVGDILDFEISPFTTSIDGEVSASAYAGTPSEVRDFVRSVISTDNDYTQKVSAALNVAALKEDERADKIKEAIGLCQEASKAIDALQMPSLNADKNGEVADALGTAKTKACERWDQMGRELTLLDTTEQVRTRKLWNYDDDVVDATQEAGDYLEEAMEVAAGL